jgi:hypothetical protein
MRRSYPYLLPTLGRAEFIEAHSEPARPRIRMIGTRDWV